MTKKTTKVHQPPQPGKLPAKTEGGIIAPALKKAGQFPKLPKAK